MQYFTCIICNASKPYNEFGPYKNPQKCLSCQKKEKAEYDRKRYDPQKDKEYRTSNKEIIKDRKQFYYLENKYEIDKRNKEYNKSHREKLKEYQKNYAKQRRAEDPIFNLRSRVSNTINYHINKNGGIKNKSSILNFLSYTIQELKNHLERQFESWMTWKNYGRYNVKTW